MSEGKERVDAIGLRETGKPGGKVDDTERSAARGGRALPCEQHGERGRIELPQRRAIDFRRAGGDARKTRLERRLRALVGQRRGRLKSAAGAG